MPSEHRSVRRTARTVARGGLWALAAVHVAEAVVLRQRRRQVDALPDGDAAPAAADMAGKVDVTAAAGSRVDPATAAAVRRDMDASGAMVVDLVPGDLPADRGLRLLRRVEADRLGSDVYYAPGGAHEAVAVDPALTGRMGRPAAARLDRGDLVKATLRAQRYAPKSAQVRVAPGLAATPSSGRDRWRELEELTAYAQPYGALAPILVAAETAHLLALTAGVLVSPAAALAALATWSAQPAAVFGGRGTPGAGVAWRPPGLAGGTLTRLPRAWADNLRTVAAGWRETRARQAERRATPLAPAPPSDTLFEPRRTTCYWCGSDALAGRLDITDLLQHKPGTFHLDECRDCGHVFQNPALTVAGLDHFYEDALRRPRRGAGRGQLRRAGRDLPQAGGGPGPGRRAPGLARRRHRARALPAGGPPTLARSDLRRARHERLGHRGGPPRPGRHRLPGHVPRAGRLAAPLLRRGQHAPLPRAHPRPAARAGRRRRRSSSPAAT